MIECVLYPHECTLSFSLLSYGSKTRCGSSASDTYRNSHVHAKSNHSQRCRYDICEAQHREYQANGDIAFFVYTLIILYSLPLPILQDGSHIVCRPSYQIVHDRNQGEGAVGKGILHPWRNLGINLAIHIAIHL